MAGFGTRCSPTLLPPLLCSDFGTRCVCRTAYRIATSVDRWSWTCLAEARIHTFLQARFCCRLPLPLARDLYFLVSVVRSLLLCRPSTIDHRLPRRQRCQT